MVGLLFDGEVHVLTSPLTFSSASLFTSYIKDNAFGTVVGEPTGNEIDFHGQNLTSTSPAQASVSPSPPPASAAPTPPSPTSPRSPPTSSSPSPAST